MNAQRLLFTAAGVAVAMSASVLQAGLFPSPARLDHLLCCGTTSAIAANHAAGSGPRSLLAMAERSSESGSAGAAAGGTGSPAAVSGGTAAMSAAPQKLEEENGYVKLGFDRLSGYTFKVPPFDPTVDPKATPPTGEEQIPDWLKKLNGRKAVVTGFMLPLKMKDNLVVEFLLLSDPMMCCYGAVPEMNQWIVVKMKGSGVRPIQDVPISFYGEIKVGAMFENGYMTGIYALDGERMADAKI